MAQAVIKLGEREDRILTIIKGKYGIKNKSDAVNFVIDKFEKELLEPQLRPEYAEKLSRIKKQKGILYKDVADLRRSIEHA